MKNKKSKKPKTRDYNILLSIQGSIDLRTKSGAPKKPKYSRKEKYKGISNIE